LNATDTFAQFTKRLTRFNARPDRAGTNDAMTRKKKAEKTNDGRRTKGRFRVESNSHAI